MAHIKTGGAVKGNRDSRSKRLGVKLYAGEKVRSGNIIIRQRGSKVHPGVGTKISKDFTIYAVTEGIVKFHQRLAKKIVSVEG